MSVLRRFAVAPEGPEVSSGVGLTFWREEGGAGSSTIAPAGLRTTYDWRTLSKTTEYVGMSLVKTGLSVVGVCVLGLLYLGLIWISCLLMLKSCSRSGPRACFCPYIAFIKSVLFVEGGREFNILIFDASWLRMEVVCPVSCPDWLMRLETFVCKAEEACA